MARKRRLFTLDGRTLSISDWAAIAGVHPTAIHNRIHAKKRGENLSDEEIVFGKRIREEQVKTTYLRGVTKLADEVIAEKERALNDKLRVLIMDFRVVMEREFNRLMARIDQIDGINSPMPDIAPTMTRTFAQDVVKPVEPEGGYPLREKLQIPATPLPEQWLDMDFLRHLKKFERLAQTLDYIPGMPDMGFPCSAFYAYDPLNNPDIDVECPDEMMAANVITQCYTAITHNTYEKWRQTLFAKPESPLMRPDEDPEAIVLTPYNPFEHLKEAPRVPSLLEPADPLPAEWVEDVVTYLENPVGKRKPNLVHWGFHDHIVATGLPEEARRRMETQGHEYIHALWPANQDKRMMDAIRLQDAARLIRAKFTEDKASSQYALYRNAIETLKFKALHGGVLQPETF